MWKFYIFSRQNVEIFDTSQRLSINNRRKVINCQKQSSFFGPTCRTAPEDYQQYKFDYDPTTGDRANTKFAIVMSVSWCFGVSRLHAKVSHCWTNFEGPPVSVQSCAFSGFSRLYSQFRKWNASKDPNFPKGDMNKYFHAKSTKR